MNDEEMSRSMTDAEEPLNDDSSAFAESGAAPASPEDDAWTFERAFERLEEIVEQLEHGAAGLEESLRLFEEGMRLLRLCYQRLEHAEQRIELLTGLDEQGRPITVPFDATATAETRAAGRRPSVDVPAETEADDPPAGRRAGTKTRRSRRRRSSNDIDAEAAND